MAAATLAFGGKLKRAGGAVFGSGPGRFVLRQSAFALSTVLTLAIPALAINAQVAQKFFPHPGMDLASAGRKPSITILAADGSLLGTRGSELGEPVRIDELPSFVVDSFLATEDRRFFEHPGFDPAAMFRASLRNYQSGHVVQGGSTITQQLVKNLFLNGEQTFQRKFEELHLALWLEARMTKAEILELYLNRIYLGANTYGLSAASNAYFSKDPSELTLAEASILAGLPKAPSQLAPHSNYEGALERSHEVVGNLLEAGKIDQLTARMALMFPPELAFRDRKEADGHFLDHVAAELSRRLPDLQGDVVVRSTLVPSAQRAAERAVATSLETEDAARRGAEEAALVAYDTEGGIAAMIGGRSYRDSQFNRATQAKRQPGSAFKPFIYLAAIEQGFDPDTLFIDRRLQVDGWEPSNYKERFLGPVRMRRALALSSNTVTVQVTEAVGRENVIDTARRVGLANDMAPHPSLALGVFEVPLDRLTAAYLPFAHQGFATEPHTISEVRTRGGRLVYARDLQLPVRVMSEGSAQAMTDLLHSVSELGTARGARIEGHEIAGKTGTTNGWRDAWFVGYSAHLTAGVWVGNDDNREMDEVSGATYPVRIWQAFMDEAHREGGYEPIPLKAQDSYPYDYNLAEAGAVYRGLRLDLQDRVYGAQAYADPYRYDGIGSILSQQEGVSGRVAGTGEYAAPPQNSGVRTYRTPQVSGRVVGPSDDGR
ncbi:transglycosylase domain-containing protein [Parvularcula maris]|uniref:PBP1A family penicillin-binding protein n=1 Tax=Parvularcula maris TaxID=2965077 RepID=A0A9X2RGV3_9PROT|nr:PBP1A family penicillin-binding protein [Parvularcula maris]MCQ8184229.1 PBP1A family penicillin-binding protein [Parvularcula maris]